VSRAEWNILGQLWKEFDLSIREFVHFLTLTFGEDLADAWTALDDDGSGELTEEEWMSAVLNIGYFGPSKLVFALLDNSDDGSISYDEFEVLEKYMKPKSDHPALPPSDDEGYSDDDSKYSSKTGSKSGSRIGSRKTSKVGIKAAEEAAEAGTAEKPEAAEPPAEDIAEGDAPAMAAPPLDCGSQE